MTDEIEIVEKTFGSVIEIEERIPVWRMPAAFGRDFSRIAGYIESQGAEVVGMPYGRYVDMDWEKEVNRGKLATFYAMLTKKWHFFVGMQTSKEMSAEDEFKSQVMVSHRYASTVHYGPYQECGKTYKALYDWTKSHGVLLQNQSIECYANDPNEVDKADIKTVIFIPLDE